jgi:hypothetical protein
MKTIKHAILNLGFALCTFTAQSAALGFSGNTLPVITENPVTSTGLEALYVINNMSGVNITYSASSASVQFSIWDSQGAAYAQPVPSSQIVRNGNRYTLSNIAGDCGLTIEDGNNTHYFWITNYIRHEFSVSSLEPANDNDCNMTTLDFQGNAARIPYYSINARAYELDRHIAITYNTLTADEGQHIFVPTETTEYVTSISETVHVPAPLCDTYFKISGDRFLESWGMTKEVTSTYFNTNAVSAIVNVTQDKEDVENEQNTESDVDALGGSAPAEINMSATVSDAAIFREWQISTDPTFNDVLLRANELEYTHTFNDMGTFYIRFVCADASGNCQWISDNYTVFIGASHLVCPNAFSPNASPGVNDEWKVSYKSLISFECHIFNKWGTKIVELTDPSQGWDGKYGGKFVPAGVYYYVIKAEGADGVKYNLSGDINIVNYK